MSRRVLRPKTRISYCETEEPDLDEYVFCEKCADYVYEYCAIHGPLLVIPDDKIPAKHNFPPCVPNAALTIPHVFLHLNYSSIPGAGLGVFTTLTLPQGVRFGPYRGQKTNEVTSDYSWQIYGSDRKPSHVVDASDGNNSNWMRFVNCSRHWREQNLVAFQYQGELYYRTIKIIPRFTELMVFYGSEYANKLHINLANYNSPKSYAQKFGAPAPKKLKASPNTKTQVGPSPEGTDTSNGKKDNGKKDINQPTNQANTSKPTEHKNIHKADMNASDKPLTENIQKENNNAHFTELSNQPNSIDKVNLKQTDKQNVCMYTAKDVYFICDMCQYQTVTKDILVRHMRLHDVKRKFVCEICSYRYCTNYLLIQHKRSHKNGLVHTGEKPYSCNVCNKKFNQAIDLKIHSRIHTGEKPYSCNICNKKFNQTSALKRHLRTHTGEKPYSCNICNKNFYEASHIKNHLRIHTGEKPYSCNICNKKFNQASILKDHSRTHTGEKPYSCNICNKTFNRVSTLKDHSRTHTGEKPYSCNICNKKFNQASYLKVHSRTHTGEKPYSCNICNKTFNRVSTLKDHSRTHTGEKPYSCNICNKKFNQASYLKSHSRTHTGEKPYSCNICNKKFNESSALKRHSRTHTGEKPYSCDICEFRASYKLALKNHLINKHLS